MPEITIYVPATLDFTALEQKHPFSSLPTKRRSAEYLYYYCSIIIEQQAKHGGWKEENEGYVPLCAKYLKKIHQEYRKFLTYLIEAEIIETDGTFQEGMKCTSFRYIEAYAKEDLKQVILKDFILTNNIRELKAEINRVNKKDLSKYNHILKWYLTHNLEIDKPAAKKWVELYFKCEEQNIENGIKKVSHSRKKQKEMSKSEQLENLKSVKNSCLHFIDKIHDKKYDESDFSIDDFGLRLHGLFTFVMKELRNFIKYEGKNLVSVDIKNSQPYFSTILLNPDFWESKKNQSGKLKLEEIDKELYKKMRKEKTTYKSITFLLSPKRLYQTDVSTNNYKNLCVNGGLYEFLQEKLRVMISDDFKTHWGQPFSSRDIVKEEVLRVLYSPNEVERRLFYEPTRIFKRLFPQVYEVFNAIKGANITPLPDRAGYTLLAAIIQKIESYCVLNKICKRISKERNDVPIFTIHDSIVTTKENAEYVKGIMEDELKNLIGAPPQLKIEYWDKSNLDTINLSYQASSYICNSCSPV